MRSGAWSASSIWSKRRLLATEIAWSSRRSQRRLPITSSCSSPWSRSSKRAMALSRNDSTGASERRVRSRTQPAAARTLSCGVRRGVSRRLRPAPVCELAAGGGGGRRFTSGEPVSGAQALSVDEVGGAQRLAAGALQLLDTEHGPAAAGDREAAVAQAEDRAGCLTPLAGGEGPCPHQLDRRAAETGGEAGPGRVGAQAVAQGAGGERPVGPSAVAGQARSIGRLCRVLRLRDEISPLQRLQ